MQFLINITNSFKKNLYIVLIGLGTSACLYYFYYRYKTSNTENFEELSRAEMEKIGNYRVNLSYPIIYFFYSDKCNYCYDFMPTWNKFKDYVLKTYPNIKIMEINASDDKNKQIISEYVNKKVLVGFPTLLIKKHDNIFIFSDKRNEKNLKNWLENVKNLKPN